MSRSTPALVAEVIIPGRPPSLNERYGHYMAEHRVTAMWTERSLLLALEARNKARWKAPVKTSPPATRWLEIDTYRMGELDQIDNGPGSLKAIIDGLKGVLIVDDRSAWVQLVRPIAAHRVSTAAEERTVIRVHLVPPAVAA